VQGGHALPATSVHIGANMRKLIILAACIAFPLMAQKATIQPSTAAPATETRTFSLQSGGRLKVSNVNGDIKVTAWDKNEVALTAIFRPSSRDEHVKIEVDSTSDSLELISKYPKNKYFGWFGALRQASCNLELKVPRSINGNFETVNGGVSLSSVAGKNRAETVNGGITFENLSGRVHAETVNGSIKGSIQNLDGDTEMETVNGSISISVSNPSGALKASTVNGSIKIQTSGVSYFEREKKSVHARLGDGNGMMKLSTVNGGITVM
jgi:hypothetical protein